MADLSTFREIVAVDFEFTAIPGERQVPLGLVAHELRSNRRFRLWQNEFGSGPPYATGPDVLMVAFYSSAEWNCYRSLNWPMPARILDLYVEFRNITNGFPLPAGRSLFGALTYFGLDPTGADEKREIQKAIGGDQWRGRFTPTEILDYCALDVEALERLLAVMLPRIDLPRALLRGRYMAAASAMEFNGTPIDTETLELLRNGWTSIQDHLIAEIDRDYHVYVGRRRTLQSLACG
jgi:DNA polymerase I